MGPERAMVGSRSLTFEAFFESESDRLYRRMWLVTGDRSEAEDVMQEAFVRLLPRWDRVASVEDPAGYLYRTAFNVLRSRGRRARVALKRIVGSGPPGDDFAAAEARHLVGHAMRALSPRQRAVLVLTELLGYPAEEAGRLLGIRASTARSLASQGRAAMRRALGDDDG